MGLHSSGWFSCLVIGVPTVVSGGVAARNRSELDASTPPISRPLQSVSYGRTVTCMRSDRLTTASGAPIPDPLELSPGGEAMRGMTDEQTAGVQRRHHRRVQRQRRRLRWQVRGQPDAAGHYAWRQERASRSHRRSPTMPTAMTSLSWHLQAATRNTRLGTSTSRRTPMSCSRSESERFDATAIETEGDERTRVFTAMAAAMPRFGDYQASVEREIPLFKLVRSS